MHAIKKLVHKVAKPKADAAVPKDASIDERAKNLKAIRTALKPTLQHIRDNEKAWRNAASGADKLLSEAVAANPEDDAAKETAKMFAGETNAATRAVSDTSLPEATYVKAVSGLEAYLKAIGGLDAEYKKLEDLRVDYEMYVGKVGKLETKGEKKGGADEKAATKIDRNQEKMQKAKEAYDQKIEFVAAQQKELYEEREGAFRVAYVSYFYTHAIMLDLMDKSLEKTMAYGLEHETQTLAFTFASLSV